MALETLFLISIISAVAVGLSVVYIIRLGIKEVIKWFRNRSAIKQADKDNIAFTLQNKLASGKYKTVQGIFNTRNEVLVEGRVIESEEIDEEIENIHFDDDDDLVIYE